MMGNFIGTYSGHHIDYARFSEDDVRIEDIARALSMICRFGGHVPRHYSVAEHSLLVAELAPEGQKLEALLHDAAEAYVSDIVSPLKRMLPDYQLVEQRIEKAICRKFHIGKMSKEIHMADMKALYVEARSFYGKEEVALWGLGKDIMNWGEYSSRDVLCFAPSPQHIEKQFMNAFLAYGGVK